MTKEEKTEIANSFPLDYAQAELGIYISPEEFAVFEKGIYAGSMDEKWDIFVLGDILFLSRSWTGYCIYKIAVKRYVTRVLLSNVQVNRDTAQYKNTDIEFDTVTLKKLVQSCLNRDDLYHNPNLDFPLIQHTIGDSSQFNKSSHTNNVASIRSLYQTLTSPPNDIAYDIEGWSELASNLLSKAIDDQLIVVEIQHKLNKSRKKFYFDDVGNEYFGYIVISQKSDFDWSKLIKTQND